MAKVTFPRMLIKMAKESLGPGNWNNERKNTSACESSRPQSSLNEIAQAELSTGMSWPIFGGRRRTARIKSASRCSGDPMGKKRTEERKERRRAQRGRSGFFLLKDGGGNKDRTGSLCWFGTDVKCLPPCPKP